VLGLLGRNGGQIPEFDADTFVRTGMEAANARARSSVEEAINGIVDTVGGSGNSMASLLSQRVMNDSQAQLAGAQNQFMGQAATLSRDNAVAGNQMLTNLLQSLRGATQVTTTQQQGTSAESQLQSTANSVVGSETSQQQQNTTSQQIQALTELVNQLVNSNTNTVGTEQVVGTTKQRGFGLGMSG
jgi:hypothetical protein